MNLSVKGGIIVKEYNSKGELTNKYCNKSDLITKNMILYLYFMLTGKKQTLKDINGNTFEIDGLIINESGAVAPANNTKYGIILGQDNELSYNDYKIENPLTSSDISYGECSKYSWQNSNNMWNNRIGITRKITYNGSGQLIITCIGLITKLTISSGTSYYVLLMKDKYTKTMNKGDSIEVTQYFEVNPTT